jgi:hypothetical protein
MIDNEATVQIAKNGKLTRKTNSTGFPATLNLPIFSPKRNYLARLILTSPRSSVSFLTT